MQTSPQKQRSVFNPRNYEKCNVKRSVGDPIAILIKTPSSRKCWVLRYWVRRTSRYLPIYWDRGELQNQNPILSSLCDAILIVIIENIDSDRAAFVSIWPCLNILRYWDEKYWFRPQPKVIDVWQKADKGENICLSVQIKPLGWTDPGHHILFTECENDRGEA